MHVENNRAKEMLPVTGSEPIHLNFEKANYTCIYVTCRDVKTEINVYCNTPMGYTIGRVRQPVVDTGTGLLPT